MNYLEIIKLEFLNYTKSTISEDINKYKKLYNLYYFVVKKLRSVIKKKKNWFLYNIIFRLV